MTNALELPSQVADKEECATRCVGNPKCVFYSGNNSTYSASSTVILFNCSIFEFCQEELATNFITWRRASVTELTNVACRTELVVNGTIVDLAVHSCGAGDNARNTPEPGERLSAQAGLLRGFIISSEAGWADANCNALVGGAAPCKGIQYPFQAPPQPFNFWQLSILWTASSRDRAIGVCGAQVT